ncbi:hypothetical protein VNO80_00772 [Phaseolus coccineus]|uniref:Uncharacterized protein n=1 Tax=Phaseolus coccineus TaxID=3886 RepID=A0AAN9NZ33_PHACN
MNKFQLGSFEGMSCWWPFICGEEQITGVLSFLRGTSEFRQLRTEIGIPKFFVFCSITILSQQDSENQVRQSYL